MQAKEFLEEAVDTISKRAASRDVDQERSMKKCVNIFNAVTGKNLTEHEGWLFMIALKLARATSGTSNIADDYIDMAAYSALAGESIFN